jgi:hypothetical protein
MKATRYFVDTDEDGNIDYLSRSVSDGVGIWAEEYYNGEWRRTKNMSVFMQDPGLGDFMYDEEEAKRIMKMLDERDGIK